MPPPHNTRTSRSLSHSPSQHPLLGWAAPHPHDCHQSCTLGNTLPVYHLTRDTMPEGSHPPLPPLPSCLHSLARPAAHRQWTACFACPLLLATRRVCEAPSPSHAPSARSSMAPAPPHIPNLLAGGSTSTGETTEWDARQGGAIRSAGMACSLRKGSSPCLSLASLWSACTAREPNQPLPHSLACLLAHLSLP